MKIKVLGFIALSLFISIHTNAQKLPDIQLNGLRVPSNIKIDGNANEWSNFQAYNGSTEIFYSIANDNERLYVIFQATKPIIARKIITQGLVFTINATGKKNVSEGVSITYPLLWGKTAIINSVLNKKGTLDMDSLDGVMNKQLSDNSKEIKIKGTDLLADSLIAVYNDVNIRVASRFSGDRIYTYELAVPLKMLKLTVTDRTFAYQIKL